MIATVLILSVLPTILCAFAFVYGLVFCILFFLFPELFVFFRVINNRTLFFYFFIHHL